VQKEAFEADSSLKFKFWKLRKALYGLPQASLLWWKAVEKQLLKNGYRKSNYDECMWFRSEEGKLVFIMVLHVDDFLVTGEDIWLSHCFDILSDAIEMKSRCGPAERYVGINIRRSKDLKTFFLDQKDFIERVFKNFGSEKKRGREMPYKYSVYDLEKGNKKGKEFKSIIGSVMFCVRTRPEIKFIISHLASFFDCWNDEIYNAAVDVVNYLYFTKDFILEISPKSLQLTVFADSDFAGDKSDRKSRTGNVHFIGGSYLDSVSMKQKSFAASVTEAEVISMTNAYLKQKYLRLLVNELGLIQEGPTNCYEDNMIAINIMRDLATRNGQNILILNSK